VSAHLRAIATENERIAAAGWYAAPGGPRVDIAAGLTRARAGTALFGPGPVPGVPPGDSGREPGISVTGEDSTAAARRLVTGAAGPVAVLNFASARSPGGGYRNGTRAQEEALCRASALYPCLLEAPEFYAAHRADPDPFFSDRVIHTPGVPVFRDPGGALLDVPFRAGFLTCAAPNAGVIAERAPERMGELPAVLRTRAGRVLEVAALMGYRRLVLGAWGCGVFRNDPARVADAFRGLLGEGGRFARHFEQVVFAILDRRSPSPVRDAFTAAFGTGPG
jgi:uncharacterized protein (TIGR02452 family)